MSDFPPDEPPTRPDTPSAPIKVPDLVDRPGDTHERVRMWRERLHKLGYSLTNRTSVFFDGELELVTRTFQFDNGLPVTGCVDGATRKAAALKTEPKGHKL